MATISASENERKVLLNGCWRTPIQVYPTNWHTKKASIRKDWYVWFRYHDPRFEELHPDGKLVLRRGMNDIKNLEERQEVTRSVIKEIQTLLDVHNYNPITNKINVAPEHILLTEDDITPKTPFIQALRYAHTKLNYVPHTLRDVKYVINGTEEAAIALKLANMPIGEVSRKHIVRIFEKCKSLNPKFSANYQNVYRSYLMALFKELIKLEAAENNPLNSIEKVVKGNIKTLDGAEDKTERDKELLTLKERKIINAHLHKNCYHFWRYVQIFFHSSTRTTELLRVKESHVDIVNQRYKTLIMKGRIWVWEWRTIKDVALPLWKELIQECSIIRNQAGEHNIDPYLFGKGLQPDTLQINPEAINRRWNRWVITDKEKIINGRKTMTNGLGIKKRFYAIKHLHTTEVMDILENEVGIEQAEKAVAAMSAHTSTDMLQQVYDVKNSIRKQNRIKGIKNSFA